MNRKRRLRCRRSTAAAAAAPSRDEFQQPLVSLVLVHVVVRRGRGRRPRGRGRRPRGRRLWVWPEVWPGVCPREIDAAYWKE